jgi:hypothetical protein
MTTKLNSPAEIIIGMQTFIKPGAKSAIQGTIHCKLLFDGTDEKVAFSHRHHVIPADSAGVEAGLRILAQSVAERLKQAHGENTQKENITLTNGIMSRFVEFWELPADTKFNDHQLDFFRQSLWQCLGV